MVSAAPLQLLFPGLIVRPLLCHQDIACPYPTSEAHSTTQRLQPESGPSGAVISPIRTRCWSSRCGGLHAQRVVLEPREKFLNDIRHIDTIRSSVHHGDWRRWQQASHKQAHGVG